MSDDDLADGSYASVESLAAVVSPPPTLSDASRYRIGPELGVGGNARVSLVRDLRLLRDVAWKQGDGRLLREARMLAQLEHPAIVPIHDMGFGEDGTAFFAMRVVRGRSLAQVLRTTPQDERQDLLRPLLQAAEAVAYAHHRGVVHRDLKPANIMIGRFGDSQVVDWGLARVLDEAEDPLPFEVCQALSGADLGRVGTPGYMSPEQSEGVAADRRSDVFSLGRILERIFGSREAMPAELAAIAQKATAPIPDNRYPDAAAFAADLTRYLDGRRVSAHSYGQGELVRRFVRAHRVPISIVVIGLLALVAMGIIHVMGLSEAREQAEVARETTAEALAKSDRHLARSLVGEARRQLELGARAESEVLAAHALALQEDPEARAILASFSGAPELERLSFVALPCNDAQVDPVSMKVLCVASDGVALWAFGESAPRRLWEHRIHVTAATLLPEGVAIGASTGWEIALLDLGGREIYRVNSRVRPTRKVSAAGSRALFESAKTSVVADVAAREITRVIPCDRDLHGALVLSSRPDVDGHLGAVLCRDGRLRRPGREEVQTGLVAPDREGIRAALTADGSLLVGTTKGELITLDDEGRIQAANRLVRGMVRLLEPSPDGRFLAIAGEGDPIVIVAIPSLAQVASFPRRVKTVRWDPSHPGELVTTGPLLERWRFVAAGHHRPLAGAWFVPLSDGVVSLDLEPDGAQRLVVGFGPSIAVVEGDTLAWRNIRMTTTKGAVLAADNLLAAGVEGLVLLDPDTLETRPHLLDTRKAFKRLNALADGTLLISTYGDVDRIIEGRAEPQGLGCPQDVASSPDRRFAAVLRENDRTIFRIRSGVPGSEFIGADHLAEAIAISNDGEHLFTARRDEVAIWNTDGELEALLQARDSLLLEVAVSPDGRWVAAGARDGSVTLWEDGVARPRAHFADHGERVPALLFSNDSRLLITGSWDRSLRVRELAAIGAPIHDVIARLTHRYGLELGEALGSTAQRPGLGVP